MPYILDKRILQAFLLMYIKKLCKILCRTKTQSPNYNLSDKCINQINNEQRFINNIEQKQTNFNNDINQSDLSICDEQIQVKQQKRLENKKDNLSQQQLNYFQTELNKKDEQIANLESLVQFYQEKQLETQNKVEFSNNLSQVSLNQSAEKNPNIEAQLDGDYLQLYQQNQQLINEIDQLQNVIEQLKQQLDKNENEKQNTNTNNDSQIQELKDALKIYESEIFQCKKDMEKKQKYNDFLENKLDNLLREYDLLQQDVNKLQINQNSQENKLEKKIQNQQEVIERLNSEICNLSNTISGKKINENQNSTNGKKIQQQLCQYSSEQQDNFSNKKDIQEISFNQYQQQLCEKNPEQQLQQVKSKNGDQEISQFQKYPVNFSLEEIQYQCQKYIQYEDNENQNENDSFISDNNSRDKKNEKLNQNDSDFNQYYNKNGDELNFIQQNQEDQDIIQGYNQNLNLQNFGEIE
ncbi:hypothetical protein PPERSA_08130 [Pseudocohnilembus persalinus]|uniref:Uncharacterized protein n=1 Tax=Pseudocohnilembus persalinus TaxID=266149 RepID=A0A0V0QL74_PSEPJ|nr:hypothetical protein PPERSA_08130 [Pseudocohnilembus persalinus]|eukprot:KRX03055.1 hypothetical protein PPERSA_08130 [Pseudocohnilembus persalinus]